MIIRPIADGDLDAITAIYADSVAHATGTFELEAPSAEEMGQRLHATLALGLPVLTAEIDGQIAGYAYAGPFRLRAAYRYTVEDSVYVEAAHRAKGVGRALLHALLSSCESLGIRQVIAVIGDSRNAGSIALHASAGFHRAGVIRDVGWKLDDWQDVIFMQKALGPGAAVPPDSPGLDCGR